MTTEFESGAPVPAPQYEVIENVADGRFELHRDGELMSSATYRQNDDLVVIPHVGTLPQHRGRGYASRLMDGILDIIRSDGRTIAPLCPFAAQHIRDDPRHHDLLRPRPA